MPKVSKKPAASKPITRSSSLPTKHSRSVDHPDMPPSTNSTSPLGPVYFWKPAQGNGYLGQWYPSEFTHEGDTYATAEMWMMVQKARLFGDEDIAERMLGTTEPRAHKALGRKVEGFDGGKWDAEKSRIVEEGNYLKFTVSEDAERLRVLLMETGERELVEASSRDRIWGIGFSEKNAGYNRKKWGQNLLGKALMVVRERLREEEAKKEETEGEAHRGEEGKGKGKQKV